MNQSYDIAPAQKKWTGRVKSSAELVGLITGIVTSIAFILTKVDAFDKTSFVLKEPHLLIAIDILNIAVLLVALIYIKPTVLSVQGDEVKSLKKHLAIGNDQDFENILTRVNELVRQLVYCIQCFAFVLGLFYLLQWFVDGSFLDYEKIKPIINHNTGMVQLFGKVSLSHEELTAMVKDSVEIKDLPALKVDAAKHLSMEILTNTTNLFSAAYLFLAFQVLFLVTIDKNNKTWRLKAFAPFSIAFLITLFNIAFVVIGFNDASLSSISHMMRLLGGIYNGVAMLLLFSRFISMEYFFKNSKSGWQRNFYFYGTVLVLPLYVVAQPLYGLFNAVEIGESPELFKAIVFLVCFWGKLIFLLFVYTMLTKKWMHSYLCMVLSQRDTLLHISKDVKEIIDLDGANGNAQHKMSEAKKTLETI